MNTNYSLPIVNLVAQRIDKLRIEQSLSLRELAKKSGISHSTLCLPQYYSKSAGV